MALIKRFRIKSFKEQQTLLQLDKISMFYDKRRILNDISLSVNKSEIVGLLGPNGAGKSTIMKIIMGIEHQKSGLICNGNNLDEIYSSINDLLNNNKYLEYGKTARQNSYNFHWDKIIQKYKKILN